MKTLSKPLFAALLAAVPAPALLIAAGILAPAALAQDPAGAPQRLEAKPSVAFLGMDAASDPQIGEAISRRIRMVLEADTALQSLSGERVADLFAKGILRGPDSRPDDPEALRRAVGGAWIAYGSLQRIAVSSKRSRWKPWSLKTAWTQGMRLRLMDAYRGKVLLDSLVTGEVPESAFLKGPDGDWGRMPPLEREKRLRIMAEAVAKEAAKALSAALKSRSAPADTTAGKPPAAPG